MYTTLAACPIFAGLSPAQLEGLFRTVHHFTKSFEIADIIAFSGDECNFLMCILEGSVKGEMVDFSGKVIKIEDIAAPRVLASAFIFGKENRFPVNIMANERVKILYIPKYEFMKLMQANIRILENYLNVISSRAQFLSEKIKFLSFKTIKGKIAQYILKLTGSGKDTVELPMPQQELAEMFGIARPSFARALGELAGEGILEVDRRNIRILDRRRLTGLVNP
jgi:CRP-like cAMP-binding protein